jgi:hypothetical protein
MSSKIFISYLRKDLTAVNLIGEELEDNGPPWL